MRKDKNEIFAPFACFCRFCFLDITSPLAPVNLKSQISNLSVQSLGDRLLSEFSHNGITGIIRQKT
ncbi:MAG: hypothetical protein J2P41_22585, partial [Blastocatellia bacterium]|nr:hypothetical protein [Blastocatellia bacterium]